MLQKTVGAHRNGVTVGTIRLRERLRGTEGEGDRMRVGGPRPPNTIPAERGRTPSDGRYCVSGSYSCVSFVNSPMAKPAAVVDMVTPRNSFFNGCPGVTYAFRRQVFNGLALNCAALSHSGRAGQDRP